MQNSPLRIETLTSPPIRIRDDQIQIRSQLVQLRFPAIYGGIIWNRPVTVVVRALDGEEKLVGIPNVTRTVMLALAGLCSAAIIVRMFLKRRKARP